MDTTTIAHDAHQSTSIEQIAERVEEELERLKVARPALSSRISRAENILVAHLSCKRQRLIRARVRSSELVSYLVKGSGGAVYVVDPNSWQCSCPDAHRRGKGCKHSIACWAMWRASTRPAPTRNAASCRCDTGSKVTRHDPANYHGDGFEHVGEIAGRVMAETVGAAFPATGTEAEAGSYEERTCPRCLGGETYNEQRGEWVACEQCSGSERALLFVYPKAKTAPCSGCRKRFRHRELFEVDGDNLTFFEGDRLCRDCGLAHGVL